ncbi:hypothetical protein ACFYO5_18930 [Streptomyces sp. NPDC006259]|uniref:hypothetical protein n=1 Tax=Streptomyces sp. NPDC006259 TaxID=3364740 RepID=UPI00369EF883
MSFPGRTFPALGAVVAMVALGSACSGSGGDEGRDRSDDSIGWKTCNALFGTDRIDALQKEFGAGTLETFNYKPLDELTSNWVDLARSWKPGENAHFASFPCQLGIDGTGKRFSSVVSWSLFALEYTKFKDGWKSMGNNQYVRREENGLHLTAVFPCKIKGSHEDQEAELSLEIETRIRNVPGFDTELLSQMTAQLARTLTDELPCANDPKIPHKLPNSE